jgi:Double-GTPase 2
MNGVNQITCPRCLAPLSEAIESCPECHLDLPANYCQTCYEAPPLPIVAIGFSRHGKTHLLAALLLTIDRLTILLPDVSYRPLGEHTLKSLITWRSAEADRRRLNPTPSADHGNAPEIPLSDPETEPSREPLIVSVSGFYDPRTLLIYDVAGESFERLTLVHQQLPVLRAAQTVWFVVSVYDLQFPVEGERKAGRMLGDLFASYQTAMEKLGASIEGRNAVIVLSKGDKLGVVKAAEVVGHDWLEEYLSSDPCAPEYKGSEAFSVEAYERGLKEISVELEKFNRHVPGGQNMVNLMRKQKMNIYFCVAAPLGADASEAGETRVPGDWKRQRVLDPLVWTLCLEKDRVEAGTLHLILDAGADSGPAYASHSGAPLPQALWQRLTQKRDVRIWFLGQSAPATPPRQPPPGAPPSRPRPRLIGPLLESLPATSRAVVISNGVIQDLSDFRGTNWNGRLLLVCTSDGEAVMNQWDRPHTVVFRTEDDLSHIASIAQRLA